MVRFTISKEELEAISETFDPYKDTWDSIEINLSKDGNSCYINRTLSKGYIIKEIKLSDKPKVNIFCSWDFHKSSKTGKFIPRPTFYKKNNDDTIRETKNSKVIVEVDEGELPVKFWEMINFLSGYKDLIDLGEFENKYKVISKDQLIDTFNTFDTDEQLQTIQEFIQDKDLSYQQLERLLDTSKEKSLQEFKVLLDNDDTSEDEWQKFFETNHWIFAGISLKLFFQRDIIPQAYIGTPDTRGRGAPISDFVCIDKYTTLVELKKHTTHIFTDTRRNTARTNTWSFSSDFIDGISQCLAQKEDLIENHNSKDFVTREGKIIKAEVKDPKVIFIIGNYKNEIPNSDSDINDKIKADTFERYRRDCRNVEIITYDELYERAYYIVNPVPMPF